MTRQQTLQGTGSPPGTVNERTSVDQTKARPSATHAWMSWVMAIVACGMFVVVAAMMFSGPSAEPVPVPGETPATPVTLTPALPLTPPNGKDRALLIGVQDYSKVPTLEDLRYTGNDVREFANLIKKHGYESRVLADDAVVKVSAAQLPDHDNIMRQVKFFFESAERGDRLILAFSGHGLMIENVPYLCPRDADPDRLKNLIKIQDLYDLAADHCKATLAWVLIDACQESYTRKVSTKGAVQAKIKPFGSKDILGMLVESPLGMKQRKLQMIQSTTAGDLALEVDELKHGLFFHKLMEGLGGEADINRDDQLTMDELFRYVEFEVPKYANDELNMTQRVVERSFGSTDVPLFQLGRRPTWVPKNCRPASENGEIVSVPSLNPALPPGKYSRNVVLRPQPPGSPAGSVYQLPDGSPLELEFVLVPQLHPSQPNTFYMLRDKVTQEQFQAYERQFQGTDKLDPAGISARAKQPQSPKCPAFYVTGTEALRFARDVGGNDQGKLPTQEQWDTAFGRSHASVASLAQQLGYPAWQARNVSQGVWAIGAALPCNRDNNPDVSPWGVRDMACNGLEWTRFDSYWRKNIGDVSNPNPPHSMSWRGWALTRKSPLTVEAWNQSGQPDEFLFGENMVGKPNHEVGFRFVLEQNR